MMACIDQFYEDMMARSEEMKQMQGYKTGENYAYLGLAPHFLVFDEYVAFMEMLVSKESASRRPCGCSRKCSRNITL
jgi:hypothetical protein